MMGVNDKLNQVIKVANSQTDFMKTLAYKSIDLEARSRRNNLIFSGFAENAGENCTSIIRDFLHNRLSIDSGHIYIPRAHRPIIVNLRDYGVIELVMANVRSLKGSPFSIDMDFPREIQEARGRLWPRMKELKRDFPRSRVQIVYPAKLIHEGRVVGDELPEWNRFVGANRISSLNTLGQISNTHLNRSAQLLNSDSTNSMPGVICGITVVLTPPMQTLYQMPSLACPR
ncbi:hypothetical protein MAR_025697 [Mya arenaria]|uniref:Uncharacterized protein n=1 Tax=Mya arenaria TaxID=6604 RepID=A0ABY7ERD9_MYAAR|nr:hypothetical protein MAR_025697 [Mya arenaria]